MLTYQAAKKIMGQNCLGPDEFTAANQAMRLSVPTKIPLVPFTAVQLKKYSKDYILILGVARDSEGRWLTLNRLREILGVDPTHSEPCLYNQDWYARESFASKTHLQTKWYLIRKTIRPETAGKNVEVIKKVLPKNEALPTAILTAFTFFAYYFARQGKILWKHDFLWCADVDHNGDQIYTGRYVDPTKVNKNGFNVHRHLSIRKCYAAAPHIIV